MSEAWLSGLALSHVLRLTLVGRAKKYHRTVQKYVCTVQYLDGLRQLARIRQRLVDLKNHEELEFSSETQHTSPTYANAW